MGERWGVEWEGGWEEKRSQPKLEHFFCVRERGSEKVCRQPILFHRCGQTPTGRTSHPRFSSCHVKTTLLLFFLAVISNNEGRRGFVILFFFCVGRLSSSSACSLSLSLSLQNF
jgi:hypothetical protein